MSDSKKDITIATYNDNAKALSEYFRGIGSRTKCVDLVIDAVEQENPRILEIGCGDGRDAEVILQRTSNYLGIDISHAMLKLAKQGNPQGDFKLVDVEEFDFPQGLDGVIAFATLLHLPKQSLGKVCKQVYDALNPGGVFLFDVKTAPSYQEFLKRDEHGERAFYLYSPEEVREIVDSQFEEFWSEEKTIGSTGWFSIALRK